MMQNSKKLAWAIVIITAVLTAYCVHVGMEGGAQVIFFTGVSSATGLYGNKQYQDRKWEELNKNNKDGNNNK
jgi:hypothetical protein